MFLRKEIAFPFAFILADSSWGWGGVPGGTVGGPPPPHGLDEREPPPGVDVFFEHEGSPWVGGWVGLGRWSQTQEVHKGESSLF